MVSSTGTSSTTKSPIARKPLWLTLAAVACGVAILLGLGTWQLQRLQWKNELIASLTVRLAADPVALPADLSDPEITFLRVRVAGIFDHDAELRLLSRTRDGAVGLHLMTPLTTSGGRVVLVDRGWAPAADDPAVTRPAGEVVVEGAVRAFEAPNRFTPANDPAGNAWFNPDRAAMAAAVGVAEVAEVYIGAISPVAAITAGELPIGDPPGVNLRNNHLGYALTWYGLAAALIVVAGLAMRRRTGDG